MLYLAPMTAKPSQLALRRRVMALRKKGLSFTKIAFELHGKGITLSPQRIQQIADPGYKDKRRAWSQA